MSAGRIADALLASDNPLKALAELLEDHERRLDALSHRAHCNRCQAMTTICVGSDQ